VDLGEISKELAPYLASGWAGRKLLGPSLDILGKQLAVGAEAALENVVGVFENAARKLEARGEQPQPVSPRSLQKIIETAAPQNDLLMTEYLGGVLASSSMSGLRDDRAAAWSGLVDRMSSYTVRTHYVTYMSLRQEIVDRQLSYEEADIPHVQIFVGLADYATALDLADEDPASIAAYVVSVMVQESLVMPTYGQNEGMPIQEYKGRQGLFFSPSVLGMQLFLWGHGYGDLAVMSFVDPVLPIAPHVQITMPKVYLTKHSGSADPS
jgi:hypothetical protein